MPIPLGILAVAGAGGAAGEPYELIQTTTLTSAQSSVTFTSIPQTYKHLQVRFAVRKSQSGSFATFHRLTFNSSSSSYSAHYLHGQGSDQFFSSSATSQSYINWVYAPDGSTDSQVFAAGILDILDYSSSSKNTTTKTLAGYHDPNAARVLIHSGAWYNTSAVTSMTFTPDSGDLASGSRFSLYGIRG